MFWRDCTFPSSSSSIPFARHSHVCLPHFRSSFEKILFSLFFSSSVYSSVACVHVRSVLHMLSFRGTRRREDEKLKKKTKQQSTVPPKCRQKCFQLYCSHNTRQLKSIRTILSYSVTSHGLAVVDFVLQDDFVDGKSTEFNKNHLLLPRSACHAQMFRVSLDDEKEKIDCAMMRSHVYTTKRRTKGEGKLNSFCVGFFLSIFFPFACSYVDEFCVFHDFSQPSTRFLNI